MSSEHIGYRINRTLGRIEAPGFEAMAEFEIHVDPSGRPALVQFDEHPDDLADGTLLRVTLADGRVLHCEVIDSSPLCVIVTRSSERFP